MANRSLPETLTANYDLLVVLNLFQEFEEFRKIKKEDVESLKIDLSIHICDYLSQGNWQFDSSTQKQLQSVS